MKLKWRRVLCVILTLCMMVTMVPGTVVTAEAADSYSLNVNLPTNNNNLLPNGDDMVLTTQLMQNVGEGSLQCDTYTITAEITSGNSAVISPTVEGKNVRLTANSAGVIGSCEITIKAFVEGLQVADWKGIFNTQQFFYDVQPVLNVTTPDIGESIDLTQCFTMTKYTYGQQSENIDIFNDQAYEVIVRNYESGWTLNGYTLTRKEMWPVNFYVEVKGTNGDWYAGGNYHFEGLDYSLSWKWDSSEPMQVEADGTLDVMLDIANSNLAGKDYTITFELGNYEQSGFVPFGTQAGLFDVITDGSNTPKVIGIRLNGAAIQSAFEGDNFIIHTKVLLGQYLVAEWGANAILRIPNYSVSWQEGELSVANTETAKDFYLDINNIASKDYDIDFTIGQGPSSNFTVLNNQSQLFTEITDTNTGKVIGIRLNGAAIAYNCRGDFEIKTEVKINNQIRHEFVHSVRLNRNNYSLRFDWDFNNGPIRVYNDSTNTRLMLNTSSLANLTNYDIDFVIGSPGDQNQFVPFDDSVQSQLASKVIDQNKVVGVDLNGVEIAKVCNKAQFSVLAIVKVGGYDISSSVMGVQLREATSNYNYYYGDTCLLPNGGMSIDPQVEYRMQNSQNPNGTWGQVDVTDVTVNVTNGAQDAVVITYNGWMWNVEARSLGTAEITVTHKTPDGGTTTYTFTVEVVDNIWREYFEYKESVDYAVPGGSIGVSLDMLNLKYNPTDGQYAANTPYEVEWSLMYPEHAQYVTFAYNNAEKTDVTVNVAQNTPLWDIPFRYTVYELDANGNRVQDAHGNVNPVYSMAYPVRVVDRFCKVQITGLNNNLEVGESMTITPTLVKVYTENGVVKESVLTPDKVMWWDDGEMFDIVDNGDGTYKITRLSDWQIETFGVSMQTVVGGEGESAGRAITFPGLEYSTWFKALRGQNDTTWMYDTEEYTLELDTTNLDDKRADITIDWMVVKWTDIETGEYEEMTSGYTVNGTTITINGKELEAQGIDAFGVAAIVKSNGYDTGFGAYTDVEILKKELYAPSVDNIDTTKPVSEVTPVVDQKTADTAVKEAMSAVDIVFEAVESGEVTVDAEGNLDKLPTALEGVISKETAENIVKAKEDGAVITVEVVAENLNREEAIQDAETAEEIAELEATVGAGKAIAQFLDLKVVIKAIGAATEDNLGELKQLKEEAMTFNLVIPEELKGEGRNYYVLRAHRTETAGEIEVTILPTTMNADGTVSFTTDRYSTYALTYSTTHVHTENLINVVEADCGNNGYTGDKVCSTCNAVLEKGSVIYATGNHNWSDWKQEKGIAYTFRECWTCGNSEYQGADDASASNSGSAQAGTSAPATGDTSNMVLWMLLMVMCGGIVLNVMRRKNK